MPGRRRRYAAVAAITLLLALGAIQLVPIERTTRPGTGDPHAANDVRWILRRACYDCHSTETRWPLWAYVAPISWQVVDDVERARAAVTFSDWPSMDRGRRIAARAMVGPMTGSHRMPLWYYVPLHPDARLSDADLAALRAWSQAAATEPD